MCKSRPTAQDLAACKAPFLQIVFCLFGWLQDVPQVPFVYSCRPETMRGTCCKATKQKTRKDGEGFQRCKRIAKLKNLAAFQGTTIWKIKELPWRAMSGIALFNCVGFAKDLEKVFRDSILQQRDS